MSNPLEPLAAGEDPNSAFGGPKAVRRMQDVYAELPESRLLPATVSAAVGAAISTVDILAPFVAAAAAAAEHAAATTQREFLREVAIRLDVLVDIVGDLESRLNAGDTRFANTLNETAQASATAGSESKARMLASAAVNSGNWNPISDLRQRKFLGYVVDWPVERIVMLLHFAQVGDWMPEVEAGTEPWDYFANYLYGTIGPEEVEASSEHHSALATAGLLVVGPENFVTFGSSQLVMRVSEKGHEFLAFVGKADAL